MRNTVSNKGTQWILDFGHDSVALSVKDVADNPKITSLVFPLAAWSLLLSRRQELLDNHLPRFPITPNQQGIFELREELHSSVGAQDTDTSGYELSDPEDNEFSWEDLSVDKWIWTVFIDLELLPHFPNPSLTIFRWDQPLPTQ